MSTPLQPPSNNGTSSTHAHNTALIHADHLSLRYGDTEVFSDLCFSIERGSFTSIVGPNGAGKTQLMRTMLNFVTPSEGYVQRNFTSKDIGYVPQKIYVDKTFPITVEEFLKTYLEPKRLWGTTTLPPLDDVININSLLRKPMGSLSGGQLQRVLLAVALSTSPTILFLDEFSAGIDPRGQSELYSYLNDLHEQSDITIVMISHDIDMAAQYADMALCLNKRMICHGNPKQVFNADTFEKMYGLPMTKLSHHEHGDNSAHNHDHV